MWIRPCVHQCLWACKCMGLCMCLHTSVHTCSAELEPEAAGLYGPEIDPGYWHARGRGGSMTPDSMQSIHLGGMDLETSPQEKSDFRPSLQTDSEATSVHIFSVSSHCQGVVTYYPPFTHIITLISCTICLCNFSYILDDYKVHCKLLYCI